MRSVSRHAREIKFEVPVAFSRVVVSRNRSALQQQEGRTSAYKRTLGISTIVHGYQNLLIYRSYIGVLRTSLSLSGHKKRSMVICVDRHGQARNAQR